MKRNILIIGALLLANSYAGRAQNYDLEMDGFSTIARLITPPELPIGVPIRVISLATNQGDSIPPGTTYSYRVYDQNTGTDYVNLTSQALNFGIGNGVQLFFTSTPFTVAGAPPNIKLCSEIYIEAGESDSSNNGLCFDVVASSSATFDLKTQYLNLVSPALSELDSFDLYGGDNSPSDITAVNAVFKNMGNTTLPVFYRIPYTFKFQNSSEDYTGTLNANLVPDDSTVRPVVTPTFDVPDKKGTYQICLYHRMEDHNPNNDTLCHKFSIIDTYVPPPPIGMEEPAKFETLEVRTVGDILLIENVTEPFNYSIVDMNGKAIATGKISSNSQLSTTELPTGIYMLQAHKLTTNVFESHRFVVK